MSIRQTLYVQVMHGGIVLAAIVAVVILGYNGTLDGQSVVAILGAAIGFAGGSVASIGAVGQVVNGKATIPLSELANREQTLRDALAASASSPAHTVHPSQVPAAEPQQ